MIVPCIDLMDGKAVQLVQGRDKALEVNDPLALLTKFSAFPEIQVIDLDAAMGTGSNDNLVELLASRAKCRIGGGVRTPERAAKLLAQGAHKIIVGTAAFNTAILHEIARRVTPNNIIIALDTKNGEIVVKGWRESTGRKAEEVIRELESYCSGFLCTYVDKEGMLQGTDLTWFRKLRSLTTHALTAAGGITTLEEIRELHKLNIDAALGMAIYTGKLNLTDLLNSVSSD